MHRGCFINSSSFEFLNRLYNFWFYFTLYQYGHNNIVTIPRHLHNIWLWLDKSSFIWKLQKKNFVLDINTVSRTGTTSNLFGIKKFIKMTLQ